MTRLALINPNTSAGTTRAMCAIASEAAPCAEINGFTASQGTSLITDERALAEAALAVEALADRVKTHDAVIVAAFGDPGLAQLRQRLSVPITGIAEAGMAEAASIGRYFAVVTTTPDLVPAIQRTAVDYGHEAIFLGTFLTPGEPAVTMADPLGLVAALRDACAKAVDAGAQAIVIGGGPLAGAARSLNETVGAVLIEPVPAAVRLALARSHKENALCP